MCKPRRIISAAGTLVCSKCRQAKSIDQFNKSHKVSSGYASSCRVCAKAFNDRWVASLPPERREAMRLASIIRTQKWTARRRLLENAHCTWCGLAFQQAELVAGPFRNYICADCIYTCWATLADRWRVAA